MHDCDIDLLANRLNYDATVFKGCSMNELLMIAGLSLGLSCLVLAIVLQFVLGNFLYGVALGFLVGGGLTYVMCIIIEKLRRGQEKGYLQQWVQYQLSKTVLLPASETIRRSGVWMIGRELS